MPDLDPADIERLLHDGAQRRGVTVDAHRNLIQTTAGRARVGFARALQVVADFEKMPSRERKVLVEHLAILKEEAARQGMSVSRFVTTMLDDADEETPARH